MAQALENYVIRISGRGRFGLIYCSFSYAYDDRLGGSVLGRYQPGTLSSLLSVGWYGSLEVEALCLFVKIDCFCGEGIVLLRVAIPLCCFRVLQCFWC